MSQLANGMLSKGLLGGLGICLTLGAVQLASGRDLIGVAPSVLANLAANSSGINRAAKSDRMSSLSGARLQTQTISLRVESLSDTSILVRVPVAKRIEPTGTEKEARGGSVAPSFIKSGDRKAAIACEPSVSVLTEVAKQLQPGRCVT